VKKRSHIFEVTPQFFRLIVVYVLGIRVISFNSGQDQFPFHRRVQIISGASAVSYTIRICDTVPAATLKYRMIRKDGLN